MTATTRPATHPTTGALWVADIDLVGHEMERPYMRIPVIATSEAEALAEAEMNLDKGEKIRRVYTMQSVLDVVLDGIASGTRYAISWKDEGTEGPVVITNLDAMEEEVSADENGVRCVATPFGSDLTWTTSLPWMRRAEAKRLAKYLGLPLDES